MRTLIICLFSFSLCACISLPKTSEELQAKSKVRYQVTLDRNLKDVEDNLNLYMSKCYDTSNRSKIYLNHASVGVDQGYEKTKLENKIRYSAYIGLSPKNYIFDIEISEDPTSHVVNLNMVGATIMWKRHFYKVESVANGNKEGCVI